MDAATQLIRFLVSKGFLTDSAQLAGITSTSDGVLQTLEQLRICNEADALVFLARTLSLELVNLEIASQSAEWDPDDLIQTVSADMCWQYRCLPFRRSDRGVHVATANPLNDDARQLFEFVLQTQVIFELAPHDTVMRHLQKEAPEALTSYDNLLNSTSDGIVEIINPAKNKHGDLDSVEAPPIVKLCNKIISDAIVHKASDIHLEPTETALDVRFRIHGSMRHIFQIPKRLQSYVTVRFKILAHMDIADRRRPQDGRAQARINGDPTDIRVSSVPTAHGEKLVLRLLSQSTYTQNFESLGMPADVIPRFLTDLTRRGRMILVTGPTGSGKSTTLYTSLQHLQDGTLNIETVENPIEYRIKGINQIQVNEAAGVTFSSALRSILRQDPDVIMIGEIRDSETATTALQAAQTGHLVLSTLHTNDAVSAIQRLVQLGCPNYLVASSLGAIVAQRLVRTICPDCVAPLQGRELAEAEERVQSYLLPVQASELVKSSGCPSCMNSGFAGRVGMYSYLSITPAIEDLINRNASSLEIAQKAAEFGYRDLRQACIALLEEKQTTLEEVLPYIQLTDSPLVSEANETAHFSTKSSTQSIAATSDANDIPPESLEKFKILLVEDDDSVRDVLAMVLAKEMFEVIEAPNGLQGLELVYEHNPQLILCDLMMPVMDGRDFLVRMKKNAKTAHIPVLMLTAADDENNEIDLLELGAADFVSKASSTNVMLSRIRKLID